MYDGSLCKQFKQDNRKRKRQNDFRHSKFEYNGILQTTVNPLEIKVAQQEESTLKKVRERVSSGDKKVSKSGARAVLLTNVELFIEDLNMTLVLKTKPVQ